MAAFRFAALAVAVLPLLSGCSEQHFRAETVWQPDGRVERAVYQPAEFFPDDARKGWDILRPVAEIGSNAFAGSIRQLPEATGEAPSLAAWGTFLSPDALPDHLRIVGADASKIGRLERSVAVNRLGLVTEYVWRETLTDVVSLADMQAARRETALLVAELAEAMLRDGTLRYDISGLLAWLRTDAAAWLDEAHATFVEAAIRREADDEAGQVLAGRLADVCARHGLHLRDVDGAFVEGNRLEEVFDAFLVAKVRETVRTPEGERISEAVAWQLLQQLGFTSSGQPLSWQPTEAWRRAIVDHFGSEEAAEAKGNELFTRMFGVYQASFFTPRRTVRYEMTVPGAVVETTGERLGEDRVVWRFDAAEAFPFGYEMSVRSLAPNEAAQKAVLGEVRVATLDAMAEYVSLVAADSGLAAAMEQAARVASLRPLEEYQAELTKREGVEPVFIARVAALRKLLTP